MDDDVRVILKKERIHRNRSSILQSSGKVGAANNIVYSWNRVLLCNLFSSRPSPRFSPCYNQ